MNGQEADAPNYQRDVSDRKIGCTFGGGQAAVIMAAAGMGGDPAVKCLNFIKYMQLTI